MANAKQRKRKAQRRRAHSDHGSVRYVHLAEPNTQEEPAMTTEQKIIDQGRIGGYVPPITDPEPEPDAIGSHAQPVDKEAQDSAKAEVLAEIHADEDERAETRDDLRARLKATPLTDLRKLSRGRFSGGYNMKKAELVERLMDCEHDA